MTAKVRIQDLQALRSGGSLYTFMGMAAGFPMYLQISRVPVKRSGSGEGGGNDQDTEETVGVFVGWSTTGLQGGSSGGYYLGVGLEIQSDPSNRRMRIDSCLIGEGLAGGRNDFFGTSFVNLVRAGSHFFASESMTFNVRATLESW